MTSSSGVSSIEALTLFGRLRGTRGLVVFVALCGVAIGLFVRQTIFVRHEVSAPAVGFMPAPGPGGVAVLVPSFSPEIRAGDQLVSVDGVPVDFDGWMTLRTTKLSLGTHQALVRRDGALVEVPVEVRPSSPAYALALVVRLLTGLVLYLIGIGAFLLRPGGLISWLFASLMLVVGAIAMTTAGNHAFLPQLYLVIMVLMSAAPGVGLHLFLLFPRPSALLRRWPWLAAVLYAPGVAFTTLWVLYNGVPASHIDGGTQFALELATRAWVGAAALGCAAIVLRNWRRESRQGDARMASQYRVLSLGTGLGLVGPAVLTAVARALNTPQLVQMSTAGVIAFALAMGVVLVRHNPLEIDRHSASVVGYVLALGLLSSVFGLALVALPLVLERVGIASSSEVLVVVTAATVLSVGPAYRRLRKRVDRWFSREQADALRTTELLLHVVDAVQRLPREKALEAVLDTARVLGSEHRALWQLDASGRAFHRTLAHGGPAEASPVPRDDAFGRALERTCGVAGLAPTLADASTQQALWAQGLAMVAPVRAHGVAVGLLGVGRRTSGFGYRPEDAAFLETLASQAGAALERGLVVTQIGRYRVERRLAAGGMAEVLVAWQLGPGGFERKVALKRLLPELAEDPRHAAGLLDEARITARLNHPNIARIYEVGLEAGQHFIAMELVDGPPLRVLMAEARKRSLLTPVPIALALGRALLSALHHAHELKDGNDAPLGVVHRDVTPANLLVSRTGEAKLVDFGIVLANSRLYRTQAGVVRGTVPYMSPEQAVGAPADRRSDVYSAGATLYLVFTGRIAFPEGPSGLRPEPASMVRPELPGALDAVLGRAMAAAPGDRYATAEAFCDALLSAVGVAPATEAEISRWVRDLHPGVTTGEGDARPDDRTETSVFPT